MARRAPEPLDSQRLDKWLWAARFYKTRALAHEAISGGKVELDGNRAKAAKAVRPGSRLRINRDGLEYEIVVQALSRQRRPASEAAALYAENAESRERREEAIALRKAAAVSRPRGSGRPTKRERRRIIRFREPD